MHWKLKALIQNAIAMLPSKVSYATYYALQRRFGTLRKMNPVASMQAAIEIAVTIQKHGRCIRNQSILEIGTGRTIGLPITMWLLGADRVLTIDLNPYLKYELIADELEYIRKHQSEIVKVFQGFEIDMKRFHRLLSFDAKSRSLNELLAMCHIEYCAPMDATRLLLRDGEVDFHVSSNVFEHIPRDILMGILKEASRVVDHQGLCVHRIDHSDHFAHSDLSLSPVNFLRYSNFVWGLLSGNRYMYMNRLHVDDFRDLFDAASHDVLAVEAMIDAKVHRQLMDGSVPVHPKFNNMSLESLATLSSLFVSKRTTASARAA